MILKKDLMALKKDITDIGKKVDNLIKAHEKGVKADAPKASKAKTIKTKPVKKAPKKKKAARVTATDKVLKIISRSKNGVDTATLMKKTGFNQRKVTNILQRTLKEGKINRVGRGLYSGVKEPLKMEAPKLTATDQVLKIVNTAKKGVDIITIKKETGFDERKVRNIIFRANKEGKIHRAERGIYKGVN
jgi:predicted transcriptional regulator of viral defense system